MSSYAHMTNVAYVKLCTCIKHMLQHLTFEDIWVRISLMHCYISYVWTTDICHLMTNEYILNSIFQSFVTYHIISVKTCRYIRHVSWYLTKCHKTCQNYVAFVTFWRCLVRTSRWRWEHSQMLAPAQATSSLGRRCFYLLRLCWFRPYPSDHLAANRSDVLDF